MLSPYRDEHVQINYIAAPFWAAAEASQGASKVGSKSEHADLTPREWVKAINSGLEGGALTTQRKAQLQPRSRRRKNPQITQTIQI
jgi:hypothetical protein